MDFANSTGSTGASILSWKGTQQSQSRFPLSSKGLSNKSLDKACFLSLCLKAKSPEALHLVQQLAAQVATDEGERRQNQRREIGAGKLTGAVGAIVGGVLEAWSRPGGPYPVWRSNQAKQFTGCPVGRRQFKTSVSVLIKLKFLMTVPGNHPKIADPSFVMTEPKGQSARYWPTENLLVLAASHGLAPTTVKDAFEFVPPNVVPRIKGPIALRPLQTRRWKHPGSRPRLAGNLNDAEALAFAEDVDAHNALVKQTRVKGCAPPRWFRVFLGSWRLHGRWYAAGGDGVYLRMNSRQRSALLINGESVIELDVGASHLTIIQGLNVQNAGPGQQDRAGFSRTADPYEGLAVPREVAKHWFMELLGKGSLPVRWSRRADTGVRSTNLKKVQAAALKRHPYLADLAWIVPAELALALDVPIKYLVGHFIAGLEAEAITRAMRELRTQGVLSLPVHDSLIVPAGSEEAARQAIRTGYEAVCGIPPFVRVRSNADSDDAARVFR